MNEKPTEKLLRLVAELGGELRKHDGSMLSDEIEVEHGIMDIQAEIEQLRERIKEVEECCINYANKLNRAGDKMRGYSRENKRQAAEIERLRDAVRFLWRKVTENVDTGTERGCADYLLGIGVTRAALKGGE